MVIDTGKERALCDQMFLKPFFILVSDRIEYVFCLFVYIILHVFVGARDCP